MCVCVGVCIFWQYFFVHTNFIKHNKHFMFTYFLLDPFEFPNYFYRIRGELIYVLSIVACIPSTFCSTLGNHQGRIYYNYPVEETYNVPFWYKFNSSAFKKHSCPTTQLRKIITDNTTILEHQNIIQKLQILEALHIRNMQPTLNRINFQTSANVLKCL